MRRCCSLTLLLFVLSSCGGPAAPTQMPPPTVTPIVVTVTAQVVSNVVGQGIRGLQNQGITEARNVRVTGTVDVTGGSATVEAKVTFTSTPSNNNGAQQIDIEVVALSLRSITPSSSGGTPFDGDIPYSTHPVEGASGMVSVVVTGTDERGGTVMVSRELPVTADNTKRAAGTCTKDDTTLCVQSRIVQ